MVGRHHQHDCIGVPAQQFERDQGNRRGGIPSFRLQHKIILQRILPFAQLHPDGFRLGRIRRDHDAFRSRADKHPPHGLLNQRFIADDPEQLLWKQLPAEGPKSRPAPTGHNHGIDGYYLIAHMHPPRLATLAFAALEESSR